MSADLCDLLIYRQYLSLIKAYSFDGLVKSRKPSKTASTDEHSEAMPLQNIDEQQQ